MLALNQHLSFETMSLLSYQKTITFFVSFVLVLTSFEVFGKDSGKNALFPTSTVIKLQVYFWKRIYTDFSVNEGVLHDRQLILPIYERVPLHGLSRRQVSDFIAQRKRSVAQKLHQLADALEKKQTLSQDQQNLLRKFYKGVTPKVLRGASGRIRFQRGLMERFRQGIARSGAYLKHFRQVFQKRNLPEELVFLPHVESSFNPMAVSRSGALGVWQFMRRTGAEFMTVNNTIDERRDPWIATESAAKLLQRNYDALGSWPLAITAYNYGHNGLKRIVKRMQSSDLGYLIRYYQYPAFGFAAKNFYAEFLAAKEVAENYQLYFGHIELEKPPTFRIVRLPKTASIYKIAKQFAVPPRKISEYNLAFQASIVKGKSFIPKNYAVKLPLNPEKYLVHDTILIKKGHTLYAVARQCGMSVAQFQKLNNLKTQTIHPGQRFQCSPSKPSKTAPSIAQNSLVQKLRQPQTKKPSNVIKKSSTPKKSANLTQANLTKTIIVQKGDTLYSLARKHRIPVKDLIALNQLEQSTIYPGQEILVKL